MAMEEANRDEEGLGLKFHQLDIIDEASVLAMVEFIREK